MTPRYAASNYDDDFCLKPTMLMWLAAVHLSRAIALPLAWGLGSVAGVTSESMALLHRLWSYETLLPSLIAAPVLYALCRRAPGAPKSVRWIWARGRLILVAAACADLALASGSLLRSSSIDDATLLPLFVVVIDLYFALYLLTARRVRDTFDDFPPPLRPGPL